jgi:hypothetical protein
MPRTWDSMSRSERLGMCAVVAALTLLMLWCVA